MRTLASVIGWIAAPWLMVLLWFIGGPVIRESVADGFRIVVMFFVVVFVVAFFGIVLSGVSN